MARGKKWEPMNREAAVVGAQVEFRHYGKWHRGTITKVHATDNGMKLYRFKSDDPKMGLYELASLNELRLPL